MIPSQTEAATSRQDWLVQQIYNYNHRFAVNLPNELAVKMYKMSQNAFSFYRGTAHLFYEDIKNTPVSHFTNDITNRAWLQGDMHLQNMGGFRDAKDHAVFDINDFDEGYWGSYTWDLRRMAVSILLVADENRISYEDSKKLVEKLVESYVEQITEFTDNNSESDFQLSAQNTQGIVKDIIKKADDKKRSKLLEKNTVVTSGKRYFKLIGDPSKPCIEKSCLQPVDSKTLAAIAEAMPAYINSISVSKRKKDGYYQLKDAALRLGSGIGSLGRFRYYLLIEGASDSPDDDVILEMKQEINSSVAIAVPDNMPIDSYNYHEGERVAKTMKAMLNHTDPLVGYTTLNNLPFFIRERSPHQEDFDYTILTEYGQFKDVVVYMGKIIAKIHALADKNYDDKLKTLSMEKEIAKAINDDVSGLKTETLNYALNYTAQVKQDYADFKVTLKCAF